jgi:hypothetical protein
VGNKKTAVIIAMGYPLLSISIRISMFDFVVIGSLGSNERIMK